MKLLKVSILSLFILSTSLFAKEDVHIVTAGANSSLSFDKGWDNSYHALFGMAGGYDYAFKGGFQLGASTSVALYSGGSSFSLAAGPGYNFSNDVENSYFVGGKVGFTTIHYSSASSSTDTFLSAEFGKRFKVLEHVSYVPGAYFEQYLKTGSDPSFSFNILRFSLIF